MTDLLPTDDDQAATRQDDGLVVNRVAESAIETLDLAALAPPEPAAFDLALFLYRGLVLREREFRQSLKDHDWEPYRGAAVAVFCSADALVPTWAYMLVAARLDGVAASVAAGTPEAVRQAALVDALGEFDWERYRDAPVVLKGCGNDLVPLDAFVQATRRLQGVAAKGHVRRAVLVGAGLAPAERRAGRHRPTGRGQARGRQAGWAAPVAAGGPCQRGRRRTVDPGGRAGV